MDDVRTYVSISVEVPCTFIHCTVLYFLLRKILHKQHGFASGFYVLFVFSAAYNLISIILNNALARFNLYGWFPEFYISSHAIARFASLSLSFLAYFHFWSNLLMAYNRFFAIVFPKHYDKMCEGSGLRLLLTVNHVVPLMLTALKSPVDVSYEPVAEGSMSLGIIFGRDDVSQEWIARSTYVSTLSGVVRTITTLMMDLVTICCIRRFLKRLGTLSRTQNNDIRLFLVSAFTFATQLWLLITNFSLYFADRAGLVTIVSILRAQDYWIYDVQTLSPCILMLLVSRSVRREYLDFYGLRSRGNSIWTTSQTASSQ